MKIFERGQVFKGYIPDFKDDPRAPKPGFILYGEHSFIVLHGHEDKTVHTKAVIVLPITSATAEVNKASREKRSMMPSYVPLEVSEYFFLDHDSYASVGQTFPASREWLDDTPVGRISESKMQVIDIQLIQSYGLQKTVKKIAEDFHKDQMKVFEESFREAAAGVPPQIKDDLS